MHHQNCIFCNIIEGKEAAAKVYEDEHILAFMDLSQVTTGHTLVIPKVHVRNIYDMSEDVAGQLFKKVPLIANAIKRAYEPLGMNILNNNESAAGQTVFHYHIHLLPRYGKEDPFNVKWMTRNHLFTRENLEEIATRIKNELD